MKKKCVLLWCCIVCIVSISTAKVLDTLIIKGLSINDESTVRNNVPLQSGADFTALDVQKAIKSLYRMELFKDIKFSILEESESSASLLLELVENPVCESFELHGFKKLKQKDLEEKLTLQKGQVITDAMAYENIKLLKNKYAEEGYLLVDIKVDLVETKVPGNVICKITIDEGKKVRIKKIEFQGNSRIKTSKLKRKFKTKEKKWFNDGEYTEETYKRHIDSLMLFYQDLGYLDAQVVDDSIWYSENKRDIYITIKLEEGKRFLAGDFYFTGNKILEKDALTARVALKKGKPFSKSKYEMTKMFIANAYREEGYLWIQLQEKYQYRGDTVDVTFDIVEGRPAIVRKIDITGNEKTREKVIRRELQVFPGQKYKQSRMERSIREVMQLNFFDNVNPDLKPNEDGTIDLVYSVEEKDNIGQFSAGVMYSQVDKLGGNFAITIPNFRGAGQQLDANIEYSKYSQRYSLGFLEPWIFDTPTSLSARAFYERFKNTIRENISTGFELGSGRRLKWPDDYFRIYVSYRLSREKDTYWDEQLLKNFKIIESGVLSRMSATLTRNDTDIPNFPNRGSILSLNGQIGGLGGNYRYLKGVVGYDWYFPMIWKFVVGMKSKFGYIAGLGEHSQIARSDLFGAGGVLYEGMIRGYPEGHFGKYGSSGSRGLSMLTFSGEVRFPVLDQQLYLAGFADMGNVWDDITDIDIGNMYPGVGFGFRLMLPMIGLIGFDFAWGLKDPTGQHFDGKPYGFTPHFIMNRGF